MVARKKKNLVIVESPAKARTINKYLGPDFEVAASKGHVRDLPKSNIGIDIENGWVPRYRALRDRKDVLEALKKQAAKAGTVYLAPDPDREGEAIAWHLKEALDLSDEKTRRVTFNEITKNAVQNAFANPTSIDMDRVAAQEARRFLDRVVGYKLSPLLSRKLAQQLSAGRVQSVAVRLVVEREREIQSFVPEEYWRIGVILSTDVSGNVVPNVVKIKKENANKDGKPKDTDKESLPESAFAAELAEWAGEKFKAENEQQTDEITNILKDASYVVTKVQQKDRQERPSPPFTTSTLQQQSSSRLRFSAKKTMQLAQRLYEGVDLGPEGSVALITYMRTDSTRISKDALDMVRRQIKQDHGDEYLPEKPVHYASGKGAQEAHEAVRPTDATYTPEKVKPYLPQDQFRLYSLIYNRFMASQMKPALFAVTNVEVEAGKGLFRAQGRILKFDGYRKVLPPAGKSTDTLLPKLAEQQPVQLMDLKSSQHFTEPPPRFNEASLVKTLEKEGIGRPSTYASILDKIEQRGYVEQKERRFYATDKGMLVTDLLVEHFPKIMDLKFTSHMEEELDQIEERKYQRNEVLNEFYEPFEQALKTADTKMLPEADKCPECEDGRLVERRSRFGIFYGCSNHPECKFIRKLGSGANVKNEPPKETEHKCPECGKPMLERQGAKGKFLGCSGYPECKTTMNFDQEGNPVLASKPTEHTCDKCGKPMVIREGSRGPFLACTGYPKCRNAKDVDSEGNPIEPIKSGIECKKCGEEMIVKRGPRGPFLGCSAYPKCRSTRRMTDEMKEQFKDKLPPPPKKKEVPDIEIHEKCPECDAPMQLKPGRWGKYFLGCTKYPKCRGTKKLTEEIEEKIAAS